ncbi:MAG: response regulator, partial [Candidatus Omnitrophota bacterium]|nr:response regulator [Candidatus Omnitrophota bacterium]
MAKQKILVIDDEQDLLDLVKIRLEHHGYDVAYLNSGEGALEKIRRDLPDLILLDIMMPGKNGYDLCYELKHDNATKTIPIVMFTAKPQWQKEIQEVSEFVAADDYVYKPFEAQDLLEKIGRLLKKKP